MALGFYPNLERHFWRRAILACVRRFYHLEGFGTLTLAATISLASTTILEGLLCIILHHLKRELNNKKIVPENLRDAGRQRLRIAVQQALKRLGNENLDYQNVAIILEDQCYSKYGKLGRSFYNSQVASTVRWLTISSMEDIQNRIEPDAVNDNKSRSSFPLNESDSLKQTNCSVIQLETCNMEKKNELKKANDKQELIGQKRTCPDNDASCSIQNAEARKELPPIPSFTNYASKRGKSDDFKIDNADRRPLSGQVEDTVSPKQKESFSSALKKRKLPAISLCEK